MATVTITTNKHAFCWYGYVNEAINALEEWISLIRFHLYNNHPSIERLEADLSTLRMYTQMLDSDFEHVVLTGEEVALIFKWRSADRTTFENKVLAIKTHGV